MTLDERIGLYLDKCPPAVSGQDGHGTAFRVACALINGFALNPEEAFRHFERYNLGCAPPWKPKEIRHKLAQAAKVAHVKPRGHLLGVNGISRGPHEAAQMAPKLVPVRLTPRKRHFRTVRTVFSDPCADAGAHTHTSEPRCGFTPSEPSETVEELISVPSCQIGRPAEIEMAVADWLAAEKSGLLGEPVVQAALWMFGPGCTVVSNERAEVGA